MKRLQNIFRIMALGLTLLLAPAMLLSAAPFVDPGTISRSDAGAAASARSSRPSVPKAFPSKSAMPKQFMPADTAEYSPYSYVRFVDNKKDVDLTDEEFFDIAGKVIFPINKYTLPKRDSLVMQLANEVLPLINRDSLELVYVMLRGAASPEGPTRFNKFLGEKRAEALLDFIKQSLTVPTGEEFDMEIDIEDYRTLCLMMRRRGDPDYGYVQAQCDLYLPKNRIQKLKTTLQGARQGRLWRRLYREYFAQLRAARIVLFFRKPNTYVSTVLPELVALPEVTPAEPLPLEPDTTKTVVPIVPPVVVEPTPVVVEPAPVVKPVPVDTPLVKPVMLRLPRRELLSVKSNLLFDFAYVPGYDRWCPIPNVALEYYPKRGHFTFGASMDFPWWQHHADHKFFEIRNYQLESRYYLRSGSIDKNPPGEGMAYRGLFFQAYVHGGLYSICFDADHGWEGEGLGGGLGIGYVMPLGKSKTTRWRLEFAAQFGFFVTRYDPYVYEHPIYKDFKDDRYYYDWIYDPDNFVRRAHRFTWFGPTRVGITLSYDLLFRRNAKKGISFNRWEYQEQDPQQTPQPVQPLQNSQQ